MANIKLGNKVFNDIEEITLNTVEGEKVVFSKGGSDLGEVIGTSYGVTLPDINTVWTDELKAQYPYAFIYIDQTTGQYGLVISNGKLYYGVSEIGGLHYDFIYDRDGTGFWTDLVADKSAWFEFDINGDEWLIDAEEIPFTEGWELLWTSYPIETKGLPYTPPTFSYETPVTVHEKAATVDEKPIGYAYTPAVLPDINTVWTGELKEKYPFAIITESVPFSGQFTLFMMNAKLYVGPNRYEQWEYGDNKSPALRVDTAVTDPEGWNDGGMSCVGLVAYLNEDKTAWWADVDGDRLLLDRGTVAFGEHQLDFTEYPLWASYPIETWWSDGDGGFVQVPESTRHYPAQFPVYKKGGVMNG